MSFGPWLSMEFDWAEHATSPPVKGSILELMCYDDMGRAQGTCFVQVESHDWNNEDQILQVQYLAIEDEFYDWWTREVRPEIDTLVLSSKPWGRETEIMVAGAIPGTQVESGNTVKCMRQPAYLKIPG